MKRYRLAALALTACAASLSVTACTAGTTTSSQAPSRSAASSPTTSRSATTPTPIPASSVSVAGPIGSFPIPAGAKVAENADLNGGTLVVITSVTAAKVLNFYESMLPQAGYTITSNTSAATNSGQEVNIVFSGHGYHGNLVAGANVPASGLNLAGVRSGHFAIISLQPV